MIVVFLALLPAMLSTKLGNRLILRAVNGRLDGIIQAERIRLSWFGPIKVTALRVLDPSGREAVIVEQIQCANGVWAFATDAETSPTSVSIADHFVIGAHISTWGSSCMAPLPRLPFLSVLLIMIRGLHSAEAVATPGTALAWPGPSGTMATPVCPETLPHPSAVWTTDSS